MGLYYDPDLGGITSAHTALYRDVGIMTSLKHKTVPLLAALQGHGQGSQLVGFQHIHPAEVENKIGADLLH